MHNICKKKISITPSQDFILDGLVLINGGLEYYHDTERLQMEFILKQWRQSGFTKEVAGLLANYQFSKPLSDPIVQPWVEKWQKLNPEHLYLMYRFTGPMENRFFMHRRRQEIDPLGWEGPPICKPFDTPYLFIRGKNDGSLTDNHVELIKHAHTWVPEQPRNRFPRKVVEVPDGGRVLSLTHPDVIAEQIEQFLNILPLDLTPKENIRDWWGMPTT